VARFFYARLKIFTKNKIHPTFSMIGSVFIYVKILYNFYEELAIRFLTIKNKLLMKNNYQILLLLAFIASNNLGFSQKKWSYGIEISGNYSDNNFTTEAEFRFKDIKSAFEQPKFTQNFGLSVEYRLNQKFVLQTGLRWLNAGYATLPYKQNFYGLSISLEEVSGSYVIDHFNSSYLDIPLSIKYYPLPKAYILAGASVNFRLKEEITSYNYNDVGELTSVITNFDQPSLIASQKGFYETPFHYRDVNATVRFGLGYDVSLFQKIKLSVQPTAEFFLLNTTPRKTDYYNRQLYNVGLTLLVTKL
jgi:Outer membrane protein beta-barrel domain